jgi:tryptophan-rich sensory protein
MTSLALDYRSPRVIAVTVAFVLVVMAVGAVIGVNAGPDAWYEALRKAPWNPPNWLFAPVWFTLYVLIGIAGARTFLRDPASPAMLLWILQMVLNWAWSPTWFRLHMPWQALAIIAVILALIVAFIVNAWRRDRVSSVAFVPYGLWVAFAASLNLAIALLN